VDIWGKCGHTERIPKKRWRKEKKLTNRLTHMGLRQGGWGKTGHNNSQKKDDHKDNVKKTTHGLGGSTSEKKKTQKKKTKKKQACVWGGRGGDGKCVSTRGSKVNNRTRIQYKILNEGWFKWQRRKPVPKKKKTNGVKLSEKIRGPVHKKRIRGVKLNGKKQNGLGIKTAKANTQTRYPTSAKRRGGKNTRK